jgi:hypothetical protein
MPAGTLPLGVLGTCSDFSTKLRATTHVSRWSYMATLASFGVFQQNQKWGSKPSNNVKVMPGPPLPKCRRRLRRSAGGRWRVQPAQPPDSCHVS